MKRLLTFLMKLFHKEKSEIKQDIEQEIIHQDSETLKLSLESDTKSPLQETEIIINELVEEKEQIKIKNINWNLINNLKNYDIVFVKMTKEEIECNDIEKSHQKRPFLIKEKKDNEKLANGYYFTSNIENNGFFKKDNYKGLKLVFYKNNYNLKKSTLLMFNKEIDLPYENIIHWLDHINKDDLIKLKKYRKLLLNQPVISTKNNKIIEIGDVILEDNNKYIIYQMDNTNCYGYYLNDVYKNIDVNIKYNYIYFNNRSYYIDFKNNRVFNNNDTLYIITRANNDVVERIKQKKKLLKYEQKKGNKKIKKR